MERLDKIIAGTGKYSRREVKELVRQGRVIVDGRLASSPEEKVDADAACLLVDGQSLDCRRYTYLMLHKPAGVLSARVDGRQQTVLDLLPPDLRRRGLFPVGRLDKDTEGLLLLTNDGGLAHRLLSPAHHVNKVYYVEVDGQLDQEDRAVFRRGLVLRDGTVCLPAELTVLDPPSQGLITLEEGKYHQVKRMLAARGKPVTYLKRLSMGPITLDPDLPLGAWRPLNRGELGQLGC